ncbi:MAG: hypothetical protein ABH859_08560 [Pseudomonadota bacterium]
MFIIRKAVLYIMFILCAIPTVIMAFYSSYIFSLLHGNKTVNLKFHAENFIYLMIICILFLGAVLLIVYVKSRKVFRELNKISILVQQGGPHANVAQYLSRLGKLGEKINTIFFQLTELNEMKSLKISSLGNLNHFLVDNMQLKVILLNPLGRITQCSKKVLLKLETTNNYLLDHNIGEIISDLKWEEIISELNKTRNSVVREKLTFKDPLKYKGDLVFYPIFDMRNNLSIIAGILEEDEITSELAIKTSHINGEKKKKPGHLIQALVRKAGELTSRKKS